MKKKIALILAGCGRFDGSEIHETTLSLLALSQQGVDVQAFAPNIPQAEVVNHITGETIPESRNIMIESARIVRGDILDISQYNAGEYDALLIPGGFGVAKNLCSFAFKGSEMTVNKDIAKAIRDTYDEKKPIGALCIAPILLSKVLSGVELTFGQDEQTAKIAEEWGNKSQKTNAGEIVLDTPNRIVTTPCYMLSDTSISEVYTGISNLVKALLSLL